MVRYSFQTKDGEFYEIKNSFNRKKDREKKLEKREGTAVQNDHRRIVLQCGADWYVVRNDGSTKRMGGWFYHRKWHIDGFSLRLETREGRRCIRKEKLDVFFNYPQRIKDLKGARVMGDFVDVKHLPENGRITNAYLK